MDFASTTFAAFFAIMSQGGEAQIDKIIKEHDQFYWDLNETIGPPVEPPKLPKYLPIQLMDPEPKIGTMRSQVPNNVQANKEVSCLALNIYFEAKSEPFRGKIAVAQVTLNRVSHPWYPKTVCSVVHQVFNGTCMFSWTCANRHARPSNKDQWEESLAIAYVMYHHHGEMVDITNQATHFHAARLGNIWPNLIPTGQIGEHRFYKEPKASRL